MKTMRTLTITLAAALMAIVVPGQLRAQGGGDEVDPLAELAALGDAVAESNPEGGGSIRAKKDVDKEMMARIKDPRNVLAKVEQVNSGRFPAVAVLLTVQTPAKEGSGKSVKKNEKLVVVPQLKVEGGEVMMSDPATLMNASAFYLRSGDRVMVRLGSKQGKVWQAEYIERK